MLLTCNFLETYRQIPLSLLPSLCPSGQSTTINLQYVHTISAVQFVGCFSGGTTSKKFGMRVKKVYSEDTVDVLSDATDTLVSYGSKYSDN